MYVTTSSRVTVEEACCEGAKPFGFLFADRVFAAMEGFTAAGDLEGEPPDPPPIAGAVALKLAPVSPEDLAADAEAPLATSLCSNGVLLCPAAAWLDRLALTAREDEGAGEELGAWLPSRVICSTILSLELTLSRDRAANGLDFALLLSELFAVAELLAETSEFVMLDSAEAILSVAPARVFIAPTKLFAMRRTPLLSEAD